jgi:hypothetical protein
MHGSGVPRFLDLAIGCVKLPQMATAASCGKAQKGKITITMRMSQPLEKVWNVFLNPVNVELGAQHR